ncbi:hypothetical protein CONLIGDRAFT_630452 [Coniochaeta ligniaria NRRL 30616]|uniref:Uncharacterized protein n=1 Tax=Coniochaeta ligniaria NRRL 30616 TaxID=1408157 RepID=A0A1J7IT09_9PEZI|nr:hypothetical protein CONLIGDRAFT_630452 [Coniochaeta ligniaria NRRL 30616]
MAHGMDLSGHRRLRMRSATLLAACRLSKGVSRQRTRQRTTRSSRKASRSISLSTLRTWAPCSKQFVTRAEPMPSFEESGLETPAVRLPDGSSQGPVTRYNFLQHRDATLRQNHEAMTEMSLDAPRARVRPLPSFNYLDIKDPLLRHYIVDFALPNDRAMMEHSARNGKLSHNKSAETNYAEMAALTGLLGQLSGDGLNRRACQSGTARSEREGCGGGEDGVGGRGAVSWRNKFLEHLAEAENWADLYDDDLKEY